MKHDIRVAIDDLTDFPAICILVFFDSRTRNLRRIAKKIAKKKGYNYYEKLRSLAQHTYNEIAFRYANYYCSRKLEYKFSEYEEMEGTSNLY